MSRRSMKESLKSLLLLWEEDIGSLDALQLDNNVQHPWSGLATEDSREDMVVVVRTAPDSPTAATCNRK